MTPQEAAAKLIWLHEQEMPRMVEDEPSAVDGHGTYSIMFKASELADAATHHVLVFYTENGFDLVTLDDYPVDLDALPSGLLMDITEPAFVIYPEGFWN